MPVKLGSQRVLSSTEPSHEPHRMIVVDPDRANGARSQAALLLRSAFLNTAT
jgi:hypothetical protein